MLHTRPPRKSGDQLRACTREATEVVGRLAAKQGAPASLEPICSFRANQSLSTSDAALHSRCHVHRAGWALTDRDEGACAPTNDIAASLRPSSYLTDTELRTSTPRSNAEAISTRQGRVDSGAAAFIRRSGYTTPKRKKPAIFWIAGFHYCDWCRRDESNTRPSHYE